MVEMISSRILIRIPTV